MVCLFSNFVLVGYVIFVLHLGTLAHGQKVTISQSTLTVIWQSVTENDADSDIWYAVIADQQYAEAGQTSSQTLMTAHTQVW